MLKLVNKDVVILVIANVQKLVNINVLNLANIVADNRWFLYLDRSGSEYYFLGPVHSSFSSVSKPNGGIVSTSILILILATRSIPC